MSQEAAAEALCVDLTMADLKLGVRVRFRPETAPRASRHYRDKVATVVQRNAKDGEVGLTFGWAGKRGATSTMRWSGGEALTWAAPRELVIVHTPTTKNGATK